jgi:hypothetical protein
MIQSPFLRRLVTILLAVLPEVYSFVECVIGLLVLAFILRWLGLADGTFARIVSTIWLIIAAARWNVRRQSHRKDKRAAPNSALAVPTLVASELSRIPVSQEVGVPTGLERREQAIQRTMEKTGLSREEVESQLRKYAL